MSGVGVTLLDTAGMRSSSDVVEQLGVERSAAAAAAADVVIMVVDAQQGWTDADGEIFDSLWGKEGPGSRSCKVRGPALLVANKQDLAGKGGTIRHVCTARHTKLVEVCEEREVRWRLEVGRM